MTVDCKCVCMYVSVFRRETLKEAWFYIQDHGLVRQMLCGVVVAALGIETIVGSSSLQHCLKYMYICTFTLSCVEIHVDVTVCLYCVIFASGFKLFLPPNIVYRPACDGCMATDYAKHQQQPVYCGLDCVLLFSCHLSSAATCWACGQLRTRVCL